MLRSEFVIDPETNAKLHNCTAAFPEETQTCKEKQGSERKMRSKGTSAPPANSSPTGEEEGGGRGGELVHLTSRFYSVSHWGRERAEMIKSKRRRTSQLLCLPGGGERVDGWRTGTRKTTRTGKNLRGVEDENREGEEGGGELLHLFMQT